MDIEDFCLSDERPGQSPCHYVEEVKRAKAQQCDPAIQDKLKQMMMKNPNVSDVLITIFFSELAKCCDDEAAAQCSHLHP